MTTYRRKGSWYYRFWHSASRPTSPYERGGFATRREAEAAGHDRRREVATASPGELGLAEYADRWLAGLAHEGLAPATVASYTERLRGHVLPELGRLPLALVTRQQVRALLSGKREAGHSKNSVRLMRAALSALMSDALDQGLVRSNPAIGGGRRRRGERQTEGERQQAINPMSRPQRDAFLTAARAHARRWAPVFELLAKTGLRPSEAFALRPEDLDAEVGTLMIARSWTGRQMQPTKTHLARKVDLTPRLVATLRRRRGQLLFTTRDGRPLDKSGARKAMRRVLVRAGLPRFRLYDLRHTYATLRLAEGAPAAYVAAQLGHATPVTTFRHYARWLPSMGRQWVERDESVGPARRAGDGRVVATRRKAAS